MKQMVVSPKQLNKELEKVLKRLHMDLRSYLEQSLSETKDYMADYIEIKKRRKGGRSSTLGKALKYIPPEDNIMVKKEITLSIGVDTSKAPYWKSINDGGYVPPANVGAFDGKDRPDPDKVGGKQVWKDTGKRYFIQPKNLITPIKYIEAGYKFLQKKLKSGKVTRKKGLVQPLDT